MNNLGSCLEKKKQNANQNTNPTTAEAGEEVAVVVEEGEEEVVMHPTVTNLTNGLLQLKKKMMHKTQLHEEKKKL